MSQRLLPLEGGRNFRDLGGYAAANGRTVRWGRLYRSGSMHGLTEADRRHLQGLGIKVICDFRTQHEREREPTLWPEEGGPPIRARDYGHAVGGLSRERETVTGEVMRGVMIGFYGEMPYEHLESYRFLFEELLAGNVPLLFNCSAGKDRTGVGAALLLSALGVSRPDIVEDYALSEQVFDFEGMVSRSASKSAAGFESITVLPPEARAPLLRSDPAYIEAALDSIDAREGSVANYLSARLGIGEPELRALRDLLLA